MSFTYVQRNSSTGNSGTATTVAVTLTGVAAGNLIRILVRHEGAPTTITCSDGTTSLTAGNKANNGNGDLSGQQFYLLSANGGNITYTATFAATRAYRGIIAEEWSYTGGTISFDVDATAASGSSNTPASNSITTTGTDELALAGCVHYFNTTTQSAYLINSLAVDQSLYDMSLTPMAVGARAFASTFTGGSSLTSSGSNEWCALLMAFKITASASFIARKPFILNQAVKRASYY